MAIFYEMVESMISRELDVSSRRQPLYAKNLKLGSTS